MTVCEDTSLLRSSVMVVADGPAFADAICFVMSRVVETMDAHVDGAIAVHVIPLQRFWNEFPGGFAADQHALICRVLRPALVLSDVPFRTDC